MTFTPTDILTMAGFVLMMPAILLVAIGSAELYRKYENWRTWRRNFKRYTSK